MMLTSILLLALLASIKPILAQSTVKSGNGMIYNCQKEPSFVPAFSNDICPSTFTTNQGYNFRFTGQTLVSNYPRAQTSYYSTAIGDIYFICKWQDPNNANNQFSCRYNAGAATGDNFGSGTVNAAAGTGVSQKCPVLRAKPKPSPGINYRKRQGPAFACPTTEQSGRFWLWQVQYQTDPQFYRCLYRTPTGGGTVCVYNIDDGSLLSDAVVFCPLQQCQAVQPYTKRRGLPLVIDKRQASRAQIIARRKELEDW